MLKRIEVKLLYPDAKAPYRAPDSIGYDLYSYEDVVIPASKFENNLYSSPGKAIINTGVSISFGPSSNPDDPSYYKEYGAFIWDRSSMGSKALRAVGFQVYGEEKVVNVLGSYLSVADPFLTKHAGCIEGTYRGEWKVVLVNLSDVDYKVAKGDRIAQVVFQEVETPDVVNLGYGDNVTLKASLRDAGGFGSTGK